MKRTILIAVAGCALAVASCKKEEAPTPADPGSATISGVILADIDQEADSNDFGMWMELETPEYPPSGTKITFQTSAASLDATPGGGTYETLSWSTTIGADGSYTISVPAINRPYDIDVFFDEFSADYVEFGGMVYENARFTFDNGGIDVEVANILDGGQYILNGVYRYDP